jgi:hypothetical protein
MGIKNTARETVIVGNQRVMSSSEKGGFSNRRIHAHFRHELWHQVMLL